MYIHIHTHTYKIQTYHQKHRLEDILCSMDPEEHDSIQEGERTQSTARQNWWRLCRQNTPLLQTLDHKFSMFLIYGYYPIRFFVDKA